jgi:hypothetical protein
VSASVLSGGALARLAAGAGAVDAAAFIATRPHLFRTKPGRALGNVALLAGWAALAATAGRAIFTSRVIAGSVAAANAAMLGAHLSHRIASPRVFVGPALSVAAVAGTLRTR